MPKKEKKGYWKSLIVALIGEVLFFSSLLIQSKMSSKQLIKGFFSWKTVDFPIFIVIVYVLFLFLSLFFIAFQNNMPGRKWQKGLLFGGLIGMFWLAANLEASIRLNIPVKAELLTTAFEAVPFALTGLLLGLIAGVRNDHVVIEKRGLRFLSVFIVALTFTLGRYFSYVILKLESQHAMMFTPTIIWTALTGLWAGFVYWALQPGFHGFSPFKRAFWQGVYLFGMQWLFINALFYFKYNRDPWDILARVGVDIVSVYVGVFIFEKYIINEDVEELA